MPTPKRIRYEVRDDSPAPSPGDWLESTRSVYLVLEVKAVSTRDGARRFNLVVVRYDSVQGQEGRRFTLRWDKRRRRRR